MASKDSETKKHAGTSPSQEEKDHVGQVPSHTRQKAEEIKEEADTLVDQIDEILEENAETFVKSFIQKGGE